jgi:hypothetical protein
MWWLVSFFHTIKSSGSLQLFAMKYVSCLCYVCDGRGQETVGKLKNLNKDFFSSAGVSPYILLKIKKRHYEHHMIETHR